MMDIGHLAREVASAELIGIAREAVHVADAVLDAMVSLKLRMNMT